MWPGAEIRAILRRPGRRPLLLLGGSAGVTTAQGCVLVASLEAFGVHLPVVTVLAVFVAGSAVAAAAPTPGGLGALEAALVGGLAQVGAPTTPAIAAVLYLTPHRLLAARAARMDRVQPAPATPRALTS